VPFDPQVVISRLDIKLQTPTPIAPPSTEASPWVSQTPYNPTDALSQTTLVKNRITYHQGSSPTPIFATIAALAKGIELLAHYITLLSAENYILRQANEALSRRRRAKKTHVHQGGVITVEDTYNVLSQREVTEQIKHDKRSREVSKNEGKSDIQCCGTYRKTGHNTRTCKEVVEVSSLSDSE